MLKAIILAAGLGTRLKTLTSDKPKALVEFRGRTLLENAIEYLKKFGVTDIVINVHHFADLVIDFVNSKNQFGINIIISDERDLLLDTGGGILKASKYLVGNDPFVVYNVDIITDMNLDDVLETHLKSSSLATLCVRDRITSRYLLFNKSNILVGWKNIKSGELITARPELEKAVSFAFSGIHIISPSIFDYISHEGKFSIIDVYLQLAKNHDMSAYNHTDSVWFDMGKFEDMERAEKEIPKLSF